MSEQGIYHNIDKGRQIISFLGLQYDLMSPTDIDGAMDDYGRGYIFFETKTVGTKFRDGQRIFFEHIANDMSKVKPIVIIYSEHNKLEPAESVSLADNFVKMVKVGYHDWIKPQYKTTVKQMTDICIRAFDYQREDISECYEAILRLI